MSELMMELIPFMKDMGKDVLVLVLEVFGTVLIPLMLYHLKEWMKSKVHDARFHCATEKLHVMATNAVAEASQTTVKILKKDKAWNRERALEVRDGVVQTVLDHLGPRGIAELKGCLGLKKDQVQALTTTYVESAVARRKAAGR